MINIKSQREIAIMRSNGRLVGNCLQMLRGLVKPGISTWDLEIKCRAFCEKEKVTPAFLGYHGFPAALCISVNEEVVHGIPNKEKTLQEGDIVSIDFGALKEGYYADAAVTVAVGKISPSHQKLLEVTQESLHKAIGHMNSGEKLGDVCHAVESYVKQYGYGVVREFVGHGIGTKLHEDPQVPNFGEAGKGPVLKVGMVLAIEPMIVEGKPETKVLKDGWTAVTKDGGFSAHFEHTVAILENGPEALTLAGI